MEEKDRKCSEIKFQEVEKVNARVKVCGAEYISPGEERVWPGWMRWMAGKRGSDRRERERKREKYWDCWFHNKSSLCAVELV